MSKLAKFFIYPLVAIHLIGWGVSSIYHEWNYKNDNDVVSSYFFSGITGTIRGFFWEYDLYHQLTHKKYQQVDIEQTENQIRKIAVYVMQNPQVDMIQARQQLQIVLSNIDENEKTELLDSVSYALSIMQEYMGALLHDAQISYINGDIHKSDKLKELEKQVEKIYPEQFEKNDEFLYNVAKRKPMQLPEGGQIIYDEELIQATIDNTDGAHQRLKELFELN